MAVGPYIGTCERLRVCQMCVEGQQERGAFLHETHPGVPMAVDAALVPFGLLKPALEIEGVQRDVRLFPSNKHPRSTARHDVAKVLPDQVIALLALLLQDLKGCLTLGTRALVRFERGLDRPEILSRGSSGVVGVVDRCQPPVTRARSTRATRVWRPPFFASRFRWREPCTSAKASAMRSPGGWRGPP